MADLPYVSEFQVKVEQHESGWDVVTIADGERSVISQHPDKTAADYAAEQIQRTATRHLGAAQQVEPDPAKYCCASLRMTMMASMGWTTI
ncbi:hypothetical protein [Mycolicibacterium agri]|uniref:hypothetical protein n=1 Tax=Mycolicibacterium agri TaxID=36811 RepID=UPI001056D553|nr:hypothetical protein [Mycolicibacterium agri]